MVVQRSFSLLRLLTTPVAVRFCSIPATNASHSTGVTELEASVRNGNPTISIPLPSRRENCIFTLRPLAETVQDFCRYVSNEDKGIDRVVFHNSDGQRISKNTRVGDLFLEDFSLTVNDAVYQVKVPEAFRSQSGELAQLDDVKAQVHRLYSSLNVELYQSLEQERLTEQLEKLRAELGPFEEAKALMDKRAVRLMGLQMGIFMRLTWWEYSWDIMEPVTYFATYSTLIGMFMYYICTNQNYEYTDAFDRQHLLSLHSQAKRRKFDVETYNRLRKEVAQIEYDLRRLRDPLLFNLPLQQPVTAEKSPFV